MQMARKISALGALLLIGFLIGPLLLALASSLKPFTPSDPSIKGAYRLLEAYTYYRPEGVSLSSMNIDGKLEDCGYKHNMVFSNNDEIADGLAWTPYSGYFDLSMWISSGFYQEIERRRADQLLKNFGPFELKFSNHCIRETQFSSICARKVERVLAAAGLSSSSSLSPPQSRPDQRRRLNSICTYLDGLVARRGGQLASNARSERWPNY